MLTCIRCPYYLWLPTWEGYILLSQWLSNPCSLLIQFVELQRGGSDHTSRRCPRTRMLPMPARRGRSSWRRTKQSGRPCRSPLSPGSSLWPASTSTSTTPTTRGTNTLQRRPIHLVPGTGFFTFCPLFLWLYMCASCYMHTTRDPTSKTVIQLVVNLEMPYVTQLIADYEFKYYTYVAFTPSILFPIFKTQIFIYDSSICSWQGSWQ